MEITLHRALAQIKTTNDRLTKLLNTGYGGRNNAFYISTRKGREDKTSIARSLKDTEALIIANYDQFNSLYNNLVALKRAVTMANAGITDNTIELKKHKVCNEEYTIAEIIAMRDIIKYKKEFLNILSNAMSNAVSEVERNNARVTERLDTHLTAMGGGEKKSLTADEVEMHTKAFLGANEYSLVDPLGLDKKIAELTEYVARFNEESDSALSVANALTTIEVDIVS